MKIKKKKLIIGIIIAAVLIFAVSQIFFDKSENGFTVENVQKGTVVQEVSENGTVQMGEDVDLNFKTSGTISNIYVRVGDQVFAGQSLAKLDTIQLSIQLAQAQSNAQAQRARLAELQRSANSDLDSYYKSTPDVLNQAYNLTDSAIRQQVADLFLYRTEASVPYFDLTYKNCNNQASAESAGQRKIVEDDLNVWREELQNLSDAPSEIDEAISKAEIYLNDAQSLLNRVNDTLSANCELTNDEKTKIDTYKPLVNAALTNLNTAITSVSARKSAIEAQKLAVENYSGGTKEEITYQQALVRQAEEGVILLQNQIRDATLLSPSEGQIAQINRRIGELAQITQPFIVFIPKSPFEIKAYIYEEDVVKVEVGDPVGIKLTAFPEQALEGKVISIDPSATLIDGVVYFGVKIDIQNPPLGTRSGMSADIIIRTEQKENVLVIPESAITTKEGKTFVQIVSGKKLQEREVQIGLRGSEDIVEVLSGLQEGEQIAITGQ
ncbi:MAG: efflux RND transporter periplasmic adaptor subunit [Patescibacteria group bacterium]